jgi:NADH-quinone oxidoreductase subunit L
VGHFASNFGDRTLIDGLMVNGSARLVGLVSRVFRRIQSGYVYHYAFVMIVGVFGLLYWWGVR